MATDDDPSQLMTLTTPRDWEQIFAMITEQECDSERHPLSRVYVEALADFLPHDPHSSGVPAEHWKHLLVERKFARFSLQYYLRAKGERKELDKTIENALYMYTNGAPLGFSQYQQPMCVALSTVLSFLDYDLIANDSAQKRVPQHKKKKRVTPDSESDDQIKSSASRRKKRRRKHSSDEDDQDESTTSSNSKKPPRKKRRKRSPTVQSTDPDCSSSESDEAPKTRSTRKRRKRSPSQDEDVDESPRKRRKIAREKRSLDADVDESPRKQSKIAKSPVRKKETQAIKVNIYYAAHALAYFMRVCEKEEDWRKAPWLLRKVIVVGLSHSALVDLCQTDNQTAASNLESAVYVDPARCANWPQFLKRLSNRADDENADEEHKADIFDLIKHYNKTNDDCKIALDLDLQLEAQSDPKRKVPNLLPPVMARVAWKCMAKDHEPPENMDMNLAGFSGKGAGNALVKMCCCESVMQPNKLVAHVKAHHATRMRKDATRVFQSGNMKEIQQAIDDDVSLLADYLGDHNPELSF